MKTIDKKALKIRRMVASDVAPTLDIWWADIPAKDMVADQAHGPRDLSFIAEYEGILVGFILAKLEYSGFPMTGTGVVFLIAVNPDYQRSGIGRMLIEALEKYCQSRGIATIRATVPRDDVKMAKYFSQAGFRKSEMINYDKSSRR
jgi:ribosomal protein S18 acetylase RimI-like enzyme